MGILKIVFARVLFMINIEKKLQLP